MAQAPPRLDPTAGTQPGYAPISWMAAASLAAALLVAPLLLFLLGVFLLPIGAFLWRAVAETDVAPALPRTLIAFAVVLGVVSPSPASAPPGSALHVLSLGGLVFGGVAVGAAVVLYFAWNAFSSASKSSWVESGSLWYH